MTEKKKVIVGLSGGVDSSVAAYLLKKQGYDVTGVTMAIWNGSRDIVPSGKHACYGPDEQEEIMEAKSIATLLDIPYHVFDCSGYFRSQILDNFRSEYLSGRTPNPCVRCNQMLKFGMLPDVAKKKGLAFDYFATGHYAVTRWDDQRKRYVLKKGKDQRKDQTYFLYRLSQDQLSGALFPLGNLTKQEVRAIASGINVPLAEKEESQDFYSGDYKDLLEVKESPGAIVDRRGNILGRHNGFWNYTIGQRKGLGIAYKEPLYVLELDRDNNTVIVGTHDEVMNSLFLVTGPNWIAFETLAGPMDVQVKIRSAQKEADASIVSLERNLVKVTMKQPTEGITPGQSAVFYLEDIVLGGGVIQQVVQET